MEAVHEVALLDLGQGGSSDDERGRRLFDALTRTGFVRLRHPPGYDVGLVRELLSAAPSFFDLGLKTLMPLHVSRLKGERGYMPFRTETALGSAVPDNKAYFTIGRPQGGVHQNLWLCEPQLPGFRELVERGLTMLEKVFIELLRLLGPTIGSPGLEDHARAGDTIFRVIDYPELADPSDSTVVRSEAHKDASALTLLPRSAPGLEIRVDGKWIPADRLAADDELIVNVGNSLEFYAKSRGYGLPSTEHRVTNGNGRRRVSAPLFGHFDKSFVIDPTTGLTVEAFLDGRLTDLRLGERVPSSA